MKAITITATVFMLAATTACSTGQKRASSEPAVAAAVAEYPMTQTDRGQVLTVDDVLFEIDRADLNSGSEAIVAQAARYLQQDPSRRAIVEGHADNTGELDYNQGLSENRSTSVKQALVAQGIDASRIDTVGYGESKPIAANDNAEGRQANRRVEIVFPR